MANKVLFVSCFATNRIVEMLREESGSNPGYAIQKFSKLITTGFIKNSASVEVLSVISVSSKSHKKLFWNEHEEVEEGISFRYVPFVNLPIIRQLSITVNSFFKTLFWGLCDRKNKRLICDALCRSGCIGSLLASKLIGLKSVGIMTDMPGMVTRGVKNERLKRMITSINLRYFKRFTSMVFLTQQSNDILNTDKKPYIIMEGSVDYLMNNDVIERSHVETRNIVYAGNLHKKHGLELLVKAFTKLEGDDLRLILFGDGPFVDELDKYTKADKRIVYKGVVENAVILKAEVDACLLINPRPSDQEFTLYSFPSKNLEYMVSGTPVATTKLPGIPEDHYPYLYLLEDESVDGFYNSLKEILSKPKEELEEMGKRTKQFVLENKNNIVQAKRILDLAFLN